MSAARPRRLASIAEHATLVAIAAMFLVPFVFVFLTAVMTDRQALTTRLWPHPFVWSNFADVFRSGPFLRYAWNTTVIAVLSTVGTVLSSVPVAYALSRLSWRGRNATLLVVLGTYILPLQVTVIPLYVVFSKLHWIGGFKPLIVPSFAGNAFSIFLLRQFFLAIPEEVVDVARADGADELRVLTKVIVPLAKPAIAVVALFSFLYAWNDFFLPLLYLGGNRHAWTLSLAIAQFRGAHSVQWNLSMAASFLVMLPIIGIFIAAQRTLVDAVAVVGRTG